VAVKEDREVNEIFSWTGIYLIIVIASLATLLLSILFGFLFHRYAKRKDGKYEEATAEPMTLLEDTEHDDLR